MTTRVLSFLLLVGSGLLRFAVVTPNLAAQVKASPAPAGSSAVVPSSGAATNWATKAIQLKYLDPDQLRSLFSGLSYVMAANREMKILTVTGPGQFVAEVEQTGKRLDVPPPPPANIEVTVYLLAVPAQAPTAVALPTDLQVFGKGEPAMPGQMLKLADSETFRVREGQGSDGSFGDANGAAAVHLAHIAIQAAYVIPGAKETVSLTGLRCTLSKTPDGAPGGDITSNVDIVPNQATLVSKAGVEKPLLIVVKAVVSH